jgi:hypothetical protein
MKDPNPMKLGGDTSDIIGGGLRIDRGLLFRVFPDF